LDQTYRSRDQAQYTMMRMQGEVLARGICSLVDIDWIKDYDETDIYVHVQKYKFKKLACVRMYHILHYT